MNPIEGNLFVVSAPSGAGKSSLLRALRELEPELGVAVSHTTRAPRPGEQDGEHYHFVDEPVFRAMVEAGEFIEHARVFDRWYGTSAAAVGGPLAAGQDLVLEIDWQGARQVRQRFPRACSIFILPPSVPALRERLTGRGQDDAAVIERRMRDAVREIGHYDEFDHILVNDDFAEALAELRCVVVASRSRREARAPRLEALLAGLLGAADLS